MDNEQIKLIRPLIVILKCQRNLYSIATIIYNRHTLHSEIKRKIEDVIVMNFILDLHTFIDIYFRQFVPNLKIYNFEKFNILIKLCSPLAKRINKWKGIKDFRDEIVAHGWTDGSEIKLPLNGAYDVPSSLVDVLYAENLVRVIVNVVRRLLREECLVAVTYMKKEYEDSLKNKRRTDLEVINTEIKKLNQLIRNTATDLNLTNWIDVLTINEFE